MILFGVFGHPEITCDRELLGMYSTREQAQAVIDTQDHELQTWMQLGGTALRADQFSPIINRLQPRHRSARGRPPHGGDLMIGHGPDGCERLSEGFDLASDCVVVEATRREISVDEKIQH